MLVTRNGLVETLSLVEPTEMERLTPSVLVEICRKVVVMSRQGSIALNTLLYQSLHVNAVPCKQIDRDQGGGGSVIPSYPAQSRHQLLFRPRT